MAAGPKDFYGPEGPRRLLKPAEVAYLLHVHVNTVRRWSQNGELRATRLGSRKDRRFRWEDVLEFLETNDNPRNPRQK